MNTIKKELNTSSKSLFSEQSKIEINTWLTRKKPTVKKEKKAVKQVVPDMALDIKTILQRYARNQSLPKQFSPLYSDEDYSDLEKMDTFERLDLLKDTKSFIQEAKQKLQNPPTQEKPKPASDPNKPAQEGSEPAS